MSRKIIDIKKQEHKGFPVLLVKVNAFGRSFWEYYVGVNEKHPMHSDITEEHENLRFLRNHPVAIALEKGTHKNENLGDFFKSFLDIMTISNDKEKLREYVKKADLKALDHAWLSYIGNHYDYLDDSYTYFGGGMCIDNFGVNDSYVSAIKAAEIIANFLDKQSKLKSKD